MPSAIGVCDRLNDVLDAIDRAALDLETWPTALKQMRDLTGSRVAQVSELGKATAVPFTWTTEPLDESEFIEAGGVDFRVNSRRRILSTQPILAVLDEASFQTEADRLKYPAWGDFLRRWDYPYVCTSPVARSSDVVTILSITRGSAQGGLDGEGKRLFAALARRVRHARRTQEVLHQRSLERVVATFEQMSRTVFACSSDAKVLAHTPGAEALLKAGDRLMLTSGRLSARSRQAASWLAEAIGRGCIDRAIASAPRIIYDVHGERPLVLEVIPVPAMASDFWGSAAVLVVARELDPGRMAGRLARLGAATMGFTPAEETVARDLLAGRSPAETAEALGIAVGTVRVHVRNIYAKTGVNNQLAFAALMGALR